MSRRLQFNLMFAFAVLLTVHAAFLFISFFALAMRNQFNIDPIGWLLMIGLLAIVFFAARSLWWQFFGDAQAGKTSTQIAAGLAFLVGAYTVLTASRDTLTIALPLLGLAISLVLLPRAREGVA